MEETAYLGGKKTIINILRKVPFLNPHEEGHLMAILELSKLRKYEKGEIITKEGDYDTWFYIILSGEVSVLKQGKVIARIDSHDGTFGELSVIDGEPRSATVCAATNITCLAVDASFRDRLSPEERLPFDAVYFRLLSEILAHRLRQTTREFSETGRELDALKKSLI